MVTNKAIADENTWSHYGNILSPSQNKMSKCLEIEANGLNMFVKAYVAKMVFIKQFP